jgi:RNase P subunit RPR2
VAIPEYARNVLPRRRVRILCRGVCEVPRHAEVNKDNWLRTEDAVTTGLYATCLKCGYQARDNNNWDRLNS